MKKLLSILIATLCLTSIFVVSAETPIKVSVNDVPVTMDVHPVIENDRTLVPIRALIEALGGTVITWDADTATAHIQSERGDILSIQIGTKTLFMNGEAYPIDVPAKIIGDRTMVPLRVISETLKYDVEWIAETREIKITK